MLFHELGGAYVRRLQGDKAENVETALRAYRQAFYWTDRDSEPVEWGAEAASLASTFVSRSEGDPQENTKVAIELLDEAVDVFAKEGDRARWAAAATNLATNRLMVTGPERADSIRRAIDLFEDVLETRPRETNPMGWASTSLGLANAYLVQAEEAEGKGVKDKDAAKAIQLYEQILAEPAVRRAPMLRAEASYNLGLAHQTLA
jgi:tetratricopeptide (TPR) repeat protein